VCDLETSKEEAKSPLKGCEYKPTMGCDTERERKKKKQVRLVVEGIVKIQHLAVNGIFSKT